MESALTQENPYINTNRKDPRYFLDKARQFREIAQQNEMDDSEYDDDDAVIVAETGPVIQEPRTIPRVKHNHGRYYDPTTKHYYKTSDVLEAIPAERVKKSDVWYPENPLSYKTVYDPDTNQHYSIDKVYNPDGTYKLVYKQLKYRPIKYPGMNHYLPNYD